MTAAVPTQCIRGGLFWTTQITGAPEAFSPSMRKSEVKELVDVEGFPSERRGALIDG